MSLRVVVLGCGPSGLTAAHAAAAFPHEDVDVRILSKPRKSFMKGAQYLHAPIPLMGDQTPFDIDYRLVGGTTQDYARKVYGGRVEAEDTSAAVLEGIHPGWDIRSAYDDLWETYGGYVIPWEATREGIIEIVGTWGADLIISSIPATLICDNPQQHSFATEFIWSTDSAYHGAADNTVICDASHDHAWYRSSLIHGWGNTEWPHRRRPPISQDHLWEVPKPIGSNCDCLASIMRVGRYGTWKKGTLVHEIFPAVQAELEKVAQRLW